MATVTKPPLLDETGQAILTALTQGLADVVSAINGDAPTGGEPKLAGTITMAYTYHGGVGVAGVATYAE